MNEHNVSSIFRALHSQFLLAPEFSYPCSSRVLEANLNSRRVGEILQSYEAMSHIQRGQGDLLLHSCKLAGMSLEGKV